MGGAAEIIRCSPASVRRYEKLGIVKAARDSAGRRLFTLSDVLKIRHLREKRFLKSKNRREMKNG